MLQKDIGKNVQNTDSICLCTKSIDIFFLSSFGYCIYFVGNRLLFPIMEN